MFLLFYDGYDIPVGGWKNMHGVFPTLQAALEALKEEKEWIDWWQIVCLNSLKVVHSNTTRVEG